MAEYIDKQKAIDAVTVRNLHPGIINALQSLIVDIPAADVVPVRHGRWNVSRTDYGWNGAEYPTHCKCSLCGREIPYQDQDRYCPNCGAKMDGEA